MDEDKAVQGELQLLESELKNLRRNNIKKAVASQIPPTVVIDVRLNTVLDQLFPAPIDRLRFELYYEERLRTHLQQWEIARAQKDHPSRLQTPNGYRPNHG